MTAMALNGSRSGGGQVGRGGGEAVAPMSEMNTTPLIDVMLVLLIMFIITVPMSTHAVKLDLPAGPRPEVRVDPVVNDLAIDRAGAVRWNGEPVTRDALRTLLATTAAMADQPELHLAPDADAPYATVDSVLADAKRARVTRMGFVGNQDYAGAF